jgi:hypothetical protein
MRAIGHIVVLALALAPPARAEEPSYDLYQPSPPALTVDRPASISLSVAPRPGYRLLGDGPVTLRLSGTGLLLPRPELRREDAADPRAEVPRFEVPVVPTRAGQARLEADLVFYVCRQKRCRPIETRATWALEVSAAPRSARP